MDEPDPLLLGPLNDPGMDTLAQSFALHRLWEAEDGGGALLSRLAPKLRAVVTKGEIGADAALMDRLPKLDIIACHGVGTEAIGRGHAEARGVRVTNTPDLPTEDVADMAWALLLAAARRIPAGDADVRGGAWAERPMATATRVWGKRLGVVGPGRIGRAVAKRAEGFGMRIAYSGRSRRGGVPYDRHPDPASLAKASDTLVVCAAGGAGTRGLVDKAAIGALGPAGILVNVSRRAVVGEAALLDALENGRLAAAGLDVFQNEPRIGPRFRALENAVLQPHNGSGTRETRMAMAELARDNLLAHFAGRELPTPVA